MKIIAIIPTYNEEDIIYWTVKYLIDQDINVHILDNESTDSTLKIIKQFPKSKVSFSSFSTNSEFNEKIQTKNIKEKIRKLEKDYDWIIKNDADEYIESPFRDMSLRQGIELVHNYKRFNSIGVQQFQFYPMSNEIPHIAGEDIRKFYDYFEIWSGNTLFRSEIHPEPHRLWKINILKCKSEIFYKKPKSPSPLSKVRLFPYLFILRHYPYRNPERTQKRIFIERRKRLSNWMIKNRIGLKYFDIPLNETFLFDRLKSGPFIFGKTKLTGKLHRWC